MLRTQPILTQLQQALAQTVRLKKRLTHLADQRPPYYWQLNPVLLRYITQLEWGLQQDLADLIAAQQESRPQ